MATIFNKLSEKYQINGYWMPRPGEVWFEPCLDPDDMPCFLGRFSVPSAMLKEEKIPYLRACARETIGVAIGSFTEQEERYEEWIEAAKAVKGCHIIPGKSVYHGGYKVWLIAITGTAK